jgi:hypothetical protein
LKKTLLGLYLTNPKKSQDLLLSIAMKNLTSLTMMKIEDQLEEKQEGETGEMATNQVF